MSCVTSLVLVWASLVCIVPVVCLELFGCEFVLNCCPDPVSVEFGFCVCACSMRAVSRVQCLLVAILGSVPWLWLASAEIRRCREVKIRW